MSAHVHASPIRVFVPNDTTARSMGAQDVADALARTGHQRHFVAERAHIRTPPPTVDYTHAVQIDEPQC